MTENDNKLPPVRDCPNGTLIVEGDKKYPLIQDGIRTLWLDVQDIKFHRGYSIN